MSEAALPGEGAEIPVREELTFVRFWREFRESRIAVAALLGVVIVVLAALLAPLLAPQNPYDLRQLDILSNLLPPGSKSSAGYTHWLGTDDQGRDMLSGILYGLRISLGVGVSSGVIALVIVQWAYYARTVRASAIVELNKEYVAAARCLALSPWRIVFRHILPNCLPPLLVVGTIQTAYAIALEATLSFVGVGMPLTEPSLGRLIANGYQYMLSGKYWISVFPGLALLFAIVSINLVGDQLRDILNPRLRR